MTGPGGEVLQRVLDARQLALKMIANGKDIPYLLPHYIRSSRFLPFYLPVTYGYTAAGFSGRMPMAELADAVVQCGRRWVVIFVSIRSGLYISKTILVIVHIITHSCSYFSVVYAAPWRLPSATLRVTLHGGPEWCTGTQIACSS